MTDLPDLLLAAYTANAKNPKAFDDAEDARLAKIQPSPSVPQRKGPIPQVKDDGSTE